MSCEARPLQRTGELASKDMMMITSIGLANANADLLLKSPAQSVSSIPRALSSTPYQVRMACTVDSVLLQPHLRRHDP
jgi:hypothetical protein